MFRDNDDEHEKRRLIRRREDADELERLRIDDEMRTARLKKADEDAWQEKQTAQIQKVGVFYRLWYRIGSTVTGVIKVAGQSIGAAAKILPPLNALITGVFFMIDLVESLFISKETRNRRAVKIANSTICTGLCVAAVVLSFNPATAPLGAALAAGAMAVASVKEGFFWYKASRDLRRAKAKLADTKEKLNTDISDFVRTQHQDDVMKFKDLSRHIEGLENKTIPLVVEEKALLVSLKQQRDAVTKKINYSVNNQETMLSTRQQIGQLATTVEVNRLDRNKKRNGFLNTFASFVGTALLAVSAFLVAAAVLSNPIGLGIAAVTILGIATVVAAKNYFFPSSEKVVPVTAPANMAAPHENTEHVSDTEHIVKQLAIAPHETERKAPTSQEVAASYRPILQKPTHQPETTAKPLVQSKHDDDDDSDSETVRFRRDH
jgi:hypothetical protein